ncbi:MAG: EamA family transporter [Candidatus Coatesbacteria bacterium]|nr:MAG: EamA family transporter [Candidatus Coatesbacteria bacterium]
MLDARMPLAAVLLILVSGTILSVWNLLLKRAEDAAVFFLGALLFALALYTPIFFVLVAPAVSFPPAAGVIALVLAGIAEGTYFILLMLAYGRGDLSLVYPISRGSAPLFILAGGLVLLSEKVTGPGYVGIGLIVAGIAAVAWPGRGVRVKPAAVVLSLLTGAAIAAHHVCYKWALAYVPPTAAIYVAWGIATGALGSYCLLTRPVSTAARYLYEHLGLALGVGVLAMAGFLCALWALNLTLVSYVGAARNVGMIISVLFGTKLLGEGGKWRRFGGAAAITAGVFAIAFA